MNEHKLYGYGGDDGVRSSVLLDDLDIDRAPAALFTALDVLGAAMKDIHDRALAAAAGVDVDGGASERLADPRNKQAFEMACAFVSAYSSMQLASFAGAEPLPYE